MADRFHRRSIRLKGYEDAQDGAYHVTICTYARSHLFGAMTDGVMHATPMGVIVEQCWDAIPVHMPMVELDEFIVMPNHVHGIIVITGRPVAGDPDVGRGGKFPAPTDPSPATTDKPPRQMPMMVKDPLGHIMQTAAVSRQAV
jgi:hypothetical protein